MSQNKLSLICPAKINLFLEIEGKRESDGYHTLDMVMHTVSLADTVHLSVFKGDGEITLSCGEKNAFLPDKEKNIAYKAAKKYLSAFDIKNYSVDIVIEKNIPISAGLGGGSTDAAGVLRALESLFSIGDKKTLDGIALSLGADVPFCMRGGSCRAQGIGEVLTDVSEMPKDIYIVIARGNAGVNTAEAYADADALPIYPRKSADRIIKALGSGDLAFANELFNRFEDVIFPRLSETKEIKSLFIAEGARGALMSGSGSAVYALIEDGKKASEICEKLVDRGVFACVSRPFSRADF